MEIELHLSETIATNFMLRSLSQKMEIRKLNLIENSNFLTNAKMKAKVSYKFSGKYSKLHRNRRFLFFYRTTFKKLLKKLKDYR